MNNLKINGIYKHYKGDLYLVQDIIYHSETGEKLIAYRALYGDNKLWCRPYNMFFDEVNKNGSKKSIHKIKKNKYQVMLQGKSWKGRLISVKMIKHIQILILVQNYTMLWKNIIV